MNPERLEQGQKLLALHDAAARRCAAGIDELNRLRATTPPLSPTLGLNDLLGNKRMDQVARELGEDYISAGRYLRQLVDITEPMTDEFIEEARKAGRE